MHANLSIPFFFFIVFSLTGAVEDLVTRLRFRAAINLQTFQAYARVGFRTERLSPINVMEGFTILKRLPLDGSGGNVKLEVKANVALPEPEIEYSTESQRSLIGMGDVEVSIDDERHHVCHVETPLITAEGVVGRPRGRTPHSLTTGRQCEVVMTEL